MPGRFKYEILTKYPHLSENESKIWTRFIENHPDFAERVDYDICVGSGHKLPEDLEEAWKRDARYLGSYKIDVVAYKNNTHYIIEIRPRAGPSAMGNVIAYMALYHVKIGDEVETEPVIITDLERPDIRKLCVEHDIEYYVS